MGTKLHDAYGKCLFDPCPEDPGRNSFAKRPGEALVQTQGTLGWSGGCNVSGTCNSCGQTIVAFQVPKGGGFWIHGAMWIRHVGCPDV